MFDAWSRVRQWIAAGHDRARAYLIRERSSLAAACAWAFAAAFLLVALALLAVILPVALPLLVVALAAAALRQRVARARGPNGLFDGRRNVRVIVRDGA